MKNPIFFLILFISSPLLAEHDKPVLLNLIGSAYQRLQDIWTEGSIDLYISGYAWHNRFTYTPERLKKYNEAAWGGGMGKGMFTEKGDWNGIFAIAFLDSHRKLEPAAGYCFLKVAHFGSNLKVGLGYSILVTSRPDILHGNPFPGILPWASIFYKKAALSAAYIPGSLGAGNVLFVISRFTF
ncbi:MAG: lipid IV(A) palmitoyltransferase PagP [Legionella sp.]|nr:lipid IV(A) palmitoyltransferase PagP [Legionella sp.]